MSCLTKEQGKKMMIKPLGTVTEIVESAMMDVSYAYEDLIFLEQKGFLLQFTDREEEVLIHINKEVKKSEWAGPLALLQEKAEERTMVFSTGDYFRMSNEDEESVHIQFYKNRHGQKNTNRPKRP
ncbi:MAG: hypothetical protein KKD01_12740 [Proteobacteria bacterium]|nr:hypothetical protein [Pseudomonadota bacterium]MBU1420256.1 hypothetical protein [Pseudomonadota bacterium]MBU1455585.1 hypothetical protein [Pseudomonadota bacterium]